jgi:hypothetical protein
MGIGLLNAVEDVSAYVDHNRMWFEFSSDPGQNTAYLPLHEQLGTLFDITGNRDVYVQSTDVPVGTPYTRIFKGLTMQPDSTTEGLERDNNVMCVGLNQRMLKPSKQIGAPWPHVDGTPVIATTSTTVISSSLGTPHTFAVTSTKNMYVGRSISVFNNDGSGNEDTTITAILGLNVTAVIWKAKTAGWTITGGIWDDELLATGFYMDKNGTLTFVKGFIDEFYNDATQTTVTTPISAGTQYVTPGTMRDIYSNRTVNVQDADGSNYENVLITNTLGGTFQATFALPHAANWIVFNGPYMKKDAVTRIQRLPHMVFEAENHRHALDRITQQATPIATTVAAPLTAGSNVAFIPDNPYGLKVGKWLTVQNADGTAKETVQITNHTNPITWSATFLTNKTAGWVITGYVTPRAFITFQPDDPTHSGFWFERFVYYDAATLDPATLRLTDITVLNPVTDAQYETYSIKRDAASQINKQAVRGKNASYGEYTYWGTSAADRGSVADIGRVIEGDVLVDDNVYTNDVAAAKSQAIVGVEREEVETFTVRTYDMIDVSMFYSPLLVEFTHTAEPTTPIRLPFVRGRLAYDGDGVPYYDLDLGRPLPAVADIPVLSFGAARNPDLPQQTSFDTMAFAADFYVPLGGTTYYVDATTGARTVTLPPSALNPTFTIVIVKSDASTNPVHILTRDGELLYAVDAPAGVTSYDLTGQHNSVVLHAGGSWHALLVNKTAVVTPTPGSGGIVSDQWGRADSALTMGHADSGQLWTPVGSAVYGVATGRGYQVSTGEGAALVQSGPTDVWASVLFPTASAGERLLLRALANTGNTDWAGLVLEQTGIGYTLSSRAIGGGLTSIQSWNTVAPANNDLVLIKLSGGNATFVLNGATQSPVASGVPSSGGYYGIGLSSAGSPTTARWDNLSVVPLSPSLDVIGIEMVLEPTGTGFQDELIVPFDCTIKEAVMTWSPVGDVTVTIERVSFASYPAAGSDITAGTLVGLNANTNRKLDITDPVGAGWTVALSAKDVLRYNLTTLNTVTKTTIMLFVARN